MNITSKNILIPLMVLFILVLSASFYGGVRYASPKTTGSISQNGRLTGLPNNGQNRAVRGTETGGGFANGTVIAKDQSSITISSAQGGSKIIVYGSSTEVSHMTVGSIGDVAIGSTITAQGTTNQDGSITAASISVRPAPSQAR